MFSFLAAAVVERVPQTLEVKDWHDAVYLRKLPQVHQIEHCEYHLT